MTTKLINFSVTQPSNPAWMNSLTANAWTALSVVNNHDDVQASNTGQYGSTGPDSVLDAWCGSVYIPGYSTAGGIFHVGGGHKNYFGNEVYVFNLATLTWSRLTNPSVEASWVGPFTDGILNDGKPNAAIHTYYYICHRNGEYVSAKRQINDDAIAQYSITRFNPSTLAWTSSTTEPPTLQPTNDEGICYDSTRDIIWMVNTNPLEWASYSFVTDAWTAYTAPTGAAQPHCGPVFCPSLTGGDAVIHFVNGAVWGLDPASPSTEKSILTVTGTGPTRGVGDMARWSPNLGCIVYYPTESNTIYRLTPPGSNWRTGTWTWSQFSLTGTTGTWTGQGTYGKFQLIERGALTIAMLVPSPASAYRAVKLVP